MKLSLAWMFDHIASPWKEHDIPDLLKKIHATTAEIERFDYYSYDFSVYTLAKVKAVKDQAIVVVSSEFDEEIVLPLRNDVKKEHYYLLIRGKNGWRWALGQDFYSEKEGLLPAFYVQESEIKGSWKNKMEKEDYILTIGNTSITHRPDLWSHRGFAREVAALLSVPLRSEQHFLTEYPIECRNRAEKSKKQTAFNFALLTDACRRLAGLYIPKVQVHHSLLPMAHRLLRVDSRPLSMLVDTTNYVMFDIGQPMHAFDEQAFPEKILNIKQAQENEKLTLLDGQEISLTSGATVVSNGKKPLSLAGIMGGIESGVTENTQGIVIEAASFDATRLRATAAHYKLRTESSTRFEKSLDPYQVTTALMRFLHILDAHSITYDATGPIICIGQDYIPQVLTVQHEFIEKKLGISLDQATVLRIMTALGFDIQCNAKTGAYTITVPSLRAKDVTITEDIVEEIGRYVGYDSIPQELPMLPTRPASFQTIEKVYTLKQFLAYSAGAFEIRNYALYDEEFLKIMRWEATNTLSIKNPLAEHMKQLVTSLVPHIFKTIYHNQSQETTLNFFEWNTIWPQGNEETSFAGIFFDEKQVVDFYQKKEIITTLLQVVGIDVRWQKADTELAPWYHPYKTAFLYHGDVCIGIAGSVNPGFMASFLPGDAFIFELKGNRILEIQSKKIQFQPLAKYQDSWRDISMLVPLKITVQSIIETMRKANPFIFNVVLLDFFQKKEWHNQRSITIRFFVRDPHKTLSSEDIEAVYNQVIHVLKPLEVEVR